MAFDLRFEPWLPLRHGDGTIHWSTPDAVAADDTATGLSAPRADFDAALTEFLIGLLTVAMQPADEDEWYHWWNNPPPPSELRKRFEALPPAFDLDGDGPRLFQDLEAADLAKCDVAPVQELLVDAKNSTLFVKPGQVNVMSRAAAAMALITLQTYSPAGGRGHRTSLRGGGPLTTLADPRRTAAITDRQADRRLWRLLWANVQTRKQWREAAHQPADVFPWLGPTRTSEAGTGTPTTPADVHPLQAYFGMPRRVRLEFGDEPAQCDLTGLHDERPVIGFRVKAYGTQYQAWRHPLSPYYKPRKGNEWLPVHAQSGGLAWKDWLGLLYASGPSATDAPAHAVASFITHRAERIGCERFDVRAFGYAVTNAKAELWVDATFPAFAVADPRRLELLRDTAQRLALGTDKVAFLLQVAVREALFSNPDEVPGDLSAVKDELWSDTEGEFYAAVDRLLAIHEVDAMAQETQRICEAFRVTLLRRACAIFDRAAPADATEPEILRRTIVARFRLVASINGGGKSGQQFYQALGLIPPSTKRGRSRSRASTAQQEKTT